MLKMFEKYTYEYILNKMLSNISDDLDKREGSVIYNAIAPCAFELAEMYRNLDSTINSVFPDTANGEFLDNLLKQFGVQRKEATKAIKKGVFYNSENQLMDIELGKRFSINAVVYSTYSKISTGTYQMMCESAGEIGNSQSGNLLPIDFVENLSVALLTDLLVPGTDEESDDEFRTRFYSSVNAVAFGGNIADYKQKVKDIDGVGAVKVIPAWNGGGTVKLIILDSQLNTATQTLINNVISAVGEYGSGIAPIGHTVTTVTATNFNITISSDITLEVGADINTVRTSIEAAINDYFTDVKRGWEDATSTIIRIAHIESKMLDVNGVLDIANTKINNSSNNLTLSNEQIPFLNEVILNA